MNTYTHQYMMCKYKNIYGCGSIPCTLGEIPANDQASQADKLLGCELLPIAWLINIDPARYTFGYSWYTLYSSWFLSPTNYQSPQRVSPSLMAVSMIAGDRCNPGIAGSVLTIGGYIASKRRDKPR